jgi:hypothetical protein
MHRGSCLCGAVSYEIEGDLGDGYYCHCSRCRKASGSAFAANAKILPAQFKLISGYEALKTYFHEATGLKRKFCSNCGSPIVSERTSPPVMAVRLGTIDTPLLKGPIGHIFVGSKPEWSQITDELPCYPERPTG